MAEKIINTRIINKHAVESDWLKAVNFTPKQGELIVYDRDSTYDYERFKIGDGTTNINDLPFATYSDWNSTEGSTQILNKPTKLSQFSDELTESEQAAVKNRIGIKSSDFDGSFDSLSNLPFYPSFNITWNGDTTGLTEVLSSEISGLNPLSYYKLSDQTASVDNVIGGSFTINYDEIYSYTVEEVYYGKGQTSGSFFITNSDDPLIGLPAIIFVEKPETMSIYISVLGTFTITFTEPGIYFINYSTLYTLSFTKSGKKLDMEFVSYDTIPTENSSNLITSGGVYTAINEAIGNALGGSY